MVAPPAPEAGTSSAGPGCEVPGALLLEPVSAVSSLAFVAAGVAIVVLARRRTPAPGAGSGAADVTRYAALVAAVGAGSVVQHGFDPAWSDLAHDLPLLATLAYVAADALADLTGRRRAWWWWVLPTLALVPLVVGAPRAGDLTQVGVAGVAVVLALARARARPELRARTAAALVLLAVGGVLGRLSRAGGPLCVPDSLWQGHAAWHVLASVALVVLAPTIGTRGAVRPTPVDATV